MTLAVTTAAATTDLTTLQAVKDDLQITDTVDDEYIERLIARVTPLICSYLCIPMADDGTVTLGRETLVQTFRPLSDHGWLIMARKPVVSVASVSEDGIAVDVGEYSFDYGRVKRLNDTLWGTSEYEVTYTAGWLLPNDSGRNLPVEIESAAIALVKMARFSRSRDPLLRSENILEGLYSYSLFDPREGYSAIPPEIAASIDRFRNVFV